MHEYYFANCRLRMDDEIGNEALFILTSGNPFELSHVGGGFKGVHRFIVSNLRDRQKSLCQNGYNHIKAKPP